MHTPSDTDGLAILGYTNKWLEYGILCPHQLRRDITEFHRPDADPNTEHYRYKALSEYLQNRDEFSNENITHLLEVLAEDPNYVMAQSVVSQLVAHNALTDAQFYSLKGHPLLKEFGISTTFLRSDLLRRLKREGPTAQVIERCVQQGDDPIHRHILEIDSLPKAVVEALSIKGTNKAVRNIAKQLLGRRRYKNQPVR